MQVDFVRDISAAIEASDFLKVHEKIYEISSNFGVFACDAEEEVRMIVL